MKIHFLTTRVVDATGGAKYDFNFYNILKRVYDDDVVLYDDNHVKEEAKFAKGDLLSFNLMYNKLSSTIFDCDYLIMNSRLYTRFVFSNTKRLSKSHPHTKIIVIHHHNNYMSHAGMMRFIHKKFEMRLLNSATQLIIPNIYVIDLLKHELEKPNIIHLESSFEKKHYRISELNNKTLLFVGNVQERKGLLYGLRAFNELHQCHPEYKFLIAGKYTDDEFYRSLDSFIMENNLSESVRFLGRVSDEELDKAYSSSDIFLFPSLLEGYGWVMIEAMGRGVPVVAFNNSAMPYTVVDKFNGLLIENKNWKKMGEGLIELVDNPGLLKSLQEGALETYDKVPSQEELNKRTEEYLISLNNC